MIEQPTRVPAAVDALVARFKGGLESDDVHVLDGPPLDYNSLPGDDILCVGMGGADGPAIENSLTKQDGLGSPRYAEVFRIHCVFSSVSGVVDMSARRARCLEVLSRVDALLKEDRGLGGVVDAVTLGTDMEWGQMQDGSGSTCDVAFDVVGKALL